MSQRIDHLVSVATVPEVRGVLRNFGDDAVWAALMTLCLAYNVKIVEPEEHKAYNDLYGKKRKKEGRSAQPSSL